MTRKRYQARPTANKKAASMPPAKDNGKLVARLRHNIPAYVYGEQHHRWGENDRLPYEALDYFNCSDLPETAVEFMAHYVKGQGFSNEATKLLNMSRLAPIGTETYMSFQMLFDAVVQQYLLWGGSIALLIRRADDGSIESIRPWQYMEDLRFGNNNEDYYRWYWKGRWFSTQGSEYISLPRYQGVDVDPEWVRAEKARQLKNSHRYYYGELYWHRPAKFGNSYYPIPKWYKSSEVLQAAGSINRAVLAKANVQFMPSLVMATPMLSDQNDNGGTSDLAHFQSQMLAYNNGDKPANFIHLQYQDKDSLPQITTLDTTDLPKALVEVGEGIAQAILRMWGVSPALAGYSTAGQLGNNQQLATEEGMLNNRAESIRNAVLDLLMPIVNAYAEGLASIDYTIENLVLHKYIPDAYLQYLTTDEVRALMGYEPLPTPQTPAA
jgi:hypothetical protein